MPGAVVTPDKSFQDLREEVCGTLIWLGSDTASFVAGIVVR
jgi:hypothetical protein